MSADWPASLPDLIVGYSGKRPVSYLEDSMDAGDVKRRPQFTTLNRKTYTCTIQLLQDPTAEPPVTQYDDFWIFYDETIAQGALPFTWQNPITSQPEEYLFDSQADLTEADLTGGPDANGKFTVAISFGIRTNP